jgi:hypothetical protein
MMLIKHAVATVVRGALVLAWVLSAGCASPYALPSRVTTSVGESPALVCRPGEVQSCRDFGHELRCTCAAF